MEFKSVNNLEFNSAVSGHKQNEERCWWKNSVAPRQFANKYEGGGGGGRGGGNKEVVTYVSILR